MNMEVSRCAFNAFARLLQTWKTQVQDANAQHWLDIDSTDIPLPLMDVLVYGLCMPDYEQPYDEHNGICYSCKHIILSANECNVNVWDQALTRVGSIALDIYPKVSFTLQEYTQPKIQLIISQPNIVISDRSVYSNLTRERQRYM